MTPLPDDIARLLRERDEARAAKDYAAADVIRSRIEAAGFAVRDTSSGGVAEPLPAFRPLDPATLPDVPAGAADRAISVHVLYEGFRDDLTRFIDSFARHSGQHDYEIVITDCAHGDAEWIEGHTGPRVRALHFSSDPGWAAGRNAALATSRGAIVAVADLSVEATGDLLGPLLEAFSDPSVGVAGPWGLRTDDLREFREAGDGPVDAVQGYFLAMRRSLLEDCRFDPKFAWYRHADIELSFRIRSRGFAAVATPAPAVRHAHRAWEALTDDERAKRSKRNFYRFLDRFKDRTDLIVSR